MNRARHLLVALVLTALAAAGCAGGDDTTDAAEPDDDQPTPGDSAVDSDDEPEPDSNDPERLMRNAYAAMFKSRIDGAEQLCIYTGSVSDPSLRK